MATIKAIIQDSIQQVLGLERDPIPTDLRDLGLSVVNNQGRIIFDSWPWDNSKIDPFEASATDADGILTLPANVDVVRAVRTVGSNETSVPIFSQDEIQAALDGETVSSLRFIHLADASTGARRIRVSEEQPSGTYVVLALKRFVPYSALASSAQGYVAAQDYQLATFVIDKAEPALRAFVDDAVREYALMKPTGKGDKLLAVAINRETEHQQREKRVSPRYPMFSELDTSYG